MSTSSNHNDSLLKSFFRHLTGLFLQVYGRAVSTTSRLLASSDDTISRLVINLRALAHHPLSRSRRRDFRRRLKEERILRELSPPTNGTRTFLIATPPHTLHCARLIKKCLEEEGFVADIAYDTETYHNYHHAIIICPQVFKSLPPPNNYIAVQMEQSVSNRWFSWRYLAILRSAGAVLDYSIRNIEFLMSSGIRSNKIFYMPISVNIDLYQQYRNFVKPTLEGREPKVLFYGDDKCDRRRRLLEGISARFPVTVVNNKFGEEILEEIASSDVVINIHYYDGALLETTRIYEVLSVGVPIISEKSADLEDHRQLHDVVDFVDVGDVNGVVCALTRILFDASYRRQKLQAIKSFNEKEQYSFANFFRRFLLAQNIISYERFKSATREYLPPVPDKPYICLTLPETPARTRAFLSQGLEDFILWPGLRFEPSWKGCALSYKYLFNTLQERGVKFAVVCEDDALFPDDFAERFARVKRYLENTQGWHLFSGLIADLSPRAVISKVEEFEGEIFIHLDTAVSTVFNVYNAELIERLGQWSVDGGAVDTNTIDRYLEALPNLRVVTVFPFLVGHRIDVSSTLWNFGNKEYLQLISKSESLLREKVADFTARNESEPSNTKVS